VINKTEINQQENKRKQENNQFDYFEQCIQKAKAGFHCKLTVEDFSPEAEMQASRENQEIITSDQPSNVKHDVWCVLLYFPFEVGNGSTVPTVVDIDENGGLQFLENKDIFSIFWCDRWFPDSSANKLSFFPGNALKDVADNWRDRVRGFLFFDWSFNHISNNKLCLQIPDLDKYLTKKPILSDRSLKDSFSEYALNAFFLSVIILN
jgi:hypothetical protein